MKTFLRILYAQLLVCIAICANATNDYYTTPGTYQWRCPMGVTSVVITMWGAGGEGGYYFTGGGGAFSYASYIAVTPGATYTVVVGTCLNITNAFSATSNSSFSLGSTTYITANGAPYQYQSNLGNPVGGATSTGAVFYTSFAGGNGVSENYNGSSYTPSGGASSAGLCGPGIDGHFGTYAGDGAVYTAGCPTGGGSGGDYYQNGQFPGGGGGGGQNFGSTQGAGGEVVIGWACSPGDPGVIGNAHTVAYPQEFTPDSVTNITSPSLPGLTIGWQQSTDGVNFTASKTPTNSLGYRFDQDSIQTTTYYRRGSNACDFNQLNNFSNTVKITVFTSTNGRNGEISGVIKTNNYTPLAGRKIYAQSLTPLKARPAGFLDSTTSDAQGKFFIDSIFYGDKNDGDSASVRFKVYADTTHGHRYDPDNALVTLSLGHPTYDLGNPAFRDTTTFALTGQVTQTCKGCLDKNGVVTNITAAVDSVRIFGIGKNYNTTNQKDSSITGFLSPPDTYGNYALVFSEEDQYTVTPTFKNHKFRPKDSLVTVHNNVSNVNFNDTTTHVISGFYGAGCGDVIGTAVLEFDDSLPNGIDGKPRLSVFKKQVTTDKKGHYSIRLPARAYKVKIISANVNDPIVPSTNQNTVKSFFKALPIANVYRDITTSDTVLDLIYNRPPQIAVSGLYDDSSAVATCDAFKNIDFWPQGIKRPITSKVYQGPISRGCLLDTGRVYITTDISNTLGNYNHDTVMLAGGIGVDSIVGAQPNTVINPGTGTYSKKFTATYTDILNRTASTDTTHPALPVVVVTGAAIDPNGKTFVTVSPQLPMVILHDPQGSLSKSTWSQSVTSEQAVSFTAKDAEKIGANLEVKVGLDEIIGIFVEEEAAAWVSIDDNFSTTNTTTNTHESVITNTTESTIETSDNPSLWGESGDLVYGAALNINYKLGTLIDWDSATCTIIGPKPVMVTDIKNDTTSFLYTISHIQNELIPALQQAADAQTRQDSIDYFENQIHVWEQLVDNNEDNIKNAPILQNLSFSNGTSQTYSNTLENSTTNTYDFDMEIDNEVAFEAGFEIAGSGLKGGVNVGFTMSTGSSSTSTNKKSTTTSYTLADDNLGGQHYAGDKFSVNVKKDPVYGTPMFELVAGLSQCPYEPGTIPLDNPVLTANVQTLTGLKKDTANFTLFMNNLSLDPTPSGARPYVIFLNAASNSSGATVLINGASAITGATIEIPNNGGVQPVTVSVIRNSAGGVYNYDDLEFIMSDVCFSPVVEQFFSNYHQFSSLKISADFASPVSGVTMVTPAANWVANHTSNNTVPILFNGYDTSRLASIAFQYNIPGTSNWLTVTSFGKNKLGKTSTSYNWNISKLADGPYNLRLQVKDKSGNIIFSPVTPGTIARTGPQLFGVPKPTNNVYVAGTQIAFRYTEVIVNTNLKSSMVELRDMTAGTTIPVQLSAFSNKMIIVPGTNIINNTGHFFRVIVDSVTDLYGNVKTRPDTSYFTVGKSTFATGSDALNVTTNPGSIYEDATGSLKVRFTRNSKVTGPTVVYYDLSGNAIFNKDYTVTYNNGQTPATGINGSEGTIIIPKDSSGASLYIHPVNDSIVTPNKVLNISLSPGGGYSIGSNYSVADTIINHNTKAPVITANKSTTLCSGDSVILSTASKINGIKVKTYLWSNKAKTQSITVKQSGSYTVKVTDANGFVGYSAPTVVTITCGSPSGLVATTLTKSTAVLNWSVVDCAKKYVVRYRQAGKNVWSTDTLAVNVDTLKGLKVNTEYEWQVASICQYPAIIISSYSAGVNFTTLSSGGAFAVSSSYNYTKAKAADGFSAIISPNPASSSAHVDVKGVKGAYSVTVLSMQGVVLWKAKDLTDTYVKIPLNSFAQGIYMVVVTDQVHAATLKLVKQ